MTDGPEDLRRCAPTAVPAVLARLHHHHAVGAVVRVRLPPLPDAAPAPSDLVHGAGFEPRSVEDGPDGTTVVARRERTLPDTVGPGMAVLVCGLNPSLYAADAGVGFARPGNRFWPAALAAGLVRVDRDPWAALDGGLGMTDLVKRATPRAEALATAEYRAGVERVAGLARWLEPGLVCVVGLAGWRAVVDRRATPGPQPSPLGGRPVYVMPSTSGLNAHSRLDDLVEHLRVVAELSGARGR